MAASPGVFHTSRGRIDHARAGQDPASVKEIPSAIPLVAEQRLAQQQQRIEVGHRQARRIHPVAGEPAGERDRPRRLRAVRFQQQHLVAPGRLAQRHAPAAHRQLPRECRRGGHVRFLSPR
jgi:hypothetical protein